MRGGPWSLISLPSLLVGKENGLRGTRRLGRRDGREGSVSRLPGLGDLLGNLQ